MEARGQGAAIPPPVAFFLSRCAALAAAAALLVFVSVPVPARADAALDAARRLADGGASGLALARIERLSPPPADPRWADWEALRLELLARGDAHDKLLTRVASLPPTAPKALRERGWMLGASAALAKGDPAGARNLLARVLWSSSYPAEALRDVRRMVIESYLKESRPQEAYLAMLRFRQDFAPIQPGEAEAFAKGLLELGKVNEALTWFDRLDAQSPVRLELRLRAGLVTPDAALETARTQAETDPRYWGVVLHIAGLRGDAALKVEARERLLDTAERPAESAARELWRFYDEHARQMGNQQALLLGDDAKWAALADAASLGRHASGRALWAFLAREARSQALQDKAIARLLAMLMADGLDRTALALFGEGSPIVATRLGAEARYRLGAVAAELGRSTTAVAWWRALTSTPPGLERDPWLLSLLEVQVAAGAYPEAAATLRAISARTPLPEAAAGTVLGTARELADAGQAEAAIQAAAALLRQTEWTVRRDAALLLGELAERRGDAKAAAEHVLDAALAQPGMADRALQRRAADMLARAGLREDARSVYEALLRGADDEEKRVLRRRMARFD